MWRGALITGVESSVLSSTNAERCILKHQAIDLRDVFVTAEIHLFIAAYFEKPIPLLFSEEGGSAWLSTRGAAIHFA